MDKLLSSKKFMSGYYKFVISLHVFKVDGVAFLYAATVYFDESGAGVVTRVVNRLIEHPDQCRDFFGWFPISTTRLKWLTNAYLQLKKVPKHRYSDLEPEMINDFSRRIDRNC